MLKTATFGYDGKGQVRLAARTMIRSAPGTRLAVRKRFWKRSSIFEREIVGRGRAWRRRLCRGVRADRERAPSATSSMCRWRRPTSPPRSRAQAVDVDAASPRGRSTTSASLCVEFFVAQDGRLLINEIAPRPHNSGHLTFDACRTSQFEQQVRAICGLPLGSPELLQPAAMANLLGDLWAIGEPELGRRARSARREAAPVRQNRTATRAQDGTPDGPRRNDGARRAGALRSPARRPR